jgi:hypothetical protein
MRPRHSTPQEIEAMKGTIAQRRAAYILTPMTTDAIPGSTANAPVMNKGWAPVAGPV